MVADLVRQLEQNGLVILPDLLSREQLAGMQRAFASRLKHQRWNDVDGYALTDPYRYMVEDVLTLDQGFVDLALHPTVKAILNAYIGERYGLCEAKGWMSMPTRRNYHGWHGDMWYDQNKVQGIPREVKVAMYLTDVTSGAFGYMLGTHGKNAPKLLKPGEVPDLPSDRIVQVTGKAGTAFLFDTSGIHRQMHPILERRQAVFLNYHDPQVPLQQEDVEYYRYHPLLLNAAFLGGLSTEDQRILGFGEKTHYQPAFERRTPYRWWHALTAGGYTLRLRLDCFAARVADKVGRMIGIKG